MRFVISLVVTGFLAFVVGFGFGGRGVASAQGGGSVYYRVIDENNGDKIERELNDIVHDDPSCRPVLAMSQSDYGKSKVILECRR